MKCRHTFTIHLSFLCYIYFTSCNVHNCMKQSFDEFYNGNTDETIKAQLAKIILLDKLEKTVNKISADELTLKDFQNKYRFRKPLLVTFRNGLNDWADGERWKLDSLLKNFGRLSVLQGNSRDIARYGGTGYVSVTLDSYLRREMAASLYDQGQNISGEHLSDTERDETEDARFGEKEDNRDPAYVFDRSFGPDSGLLDTLHLPAYVPTKEAACIVMLGGTGTGLSFHKHLDAWNAVIRGRKRWFMYSASRTPPGGNTHGYTNTEWLRKIYPRLSAEDKPLEFVQHAGELLYIPESIYHMAINLDLTLAVGFQSLHPTTVLGRLFVKQEDIEGSDDLASWTYPLRPATFLRRLLPDNTEVMLKLARMYQRLKQFTKALELLELALERDPYFVVALISRCLVDEKSGNAERASACFDQARKLAPNLFEVYAISGDFYLRHGEPRKARDMYKKGAEVTEYEPGRRHFLEMFKRAQKIIADNVK